MRVNMIIYMYIYIYIYLDIYTLKGTPNPKPLKEP